MKLQRPGLSFQKTLLNIHEPHKYKPHDHVLFMYGKRVGMIQKLKDKDI
jgi:hypothetical protein